MDMDDGIYTLTDENGQEYAFELLATCEYKGGHYYAMIPAKQPGDTEETDEFSEYIILKSVMEGDEESLVTIDDDDEFDEVADYFDDMFTREIDYDSGTGESGN